MAQPGGRVGRPCVEWRDRSCEPEEGKAAMKEETREAQGKSRKPDTEAEGLAWCLALYRKIQRKRRGQGVRRADHR